MLFKVTKAGKTNYVWGSLHTCQKELHELSLEADLAFKNADRVVLEPTKIEDSLKNLLLTWWTVHASRKPFSNILSENKILEPFLQTLKMNKIYAGYSDNNLILEINNYFPIALAMRAMFPLKPDELLKEGELFENRLSQTANSLNKPIFYLETIEEQLKKAYGLNLHYEEQINIAIAIWHISRNHLYANKYLSQVYLTGNSNLLYLVGVYSQRAYPNEGDFNKYHQLINQYYFQFIRQRDIEFSEAMKPHLDVGNSFHIIGAFHLPGVMKALSASGYDIEAITPKLTSIASKEAAEKPLISTNLPSSAQVPDDLISSTEQFNFGLHCLQQAEKCFQLAADFGHLESQQKLNKLYALNYTQRKFVFQGNPFSSSSSHSSNNNAIPKSTLYEITKSGKTNYIYGTMPINLRQEVAQFSPIAKTIFENAKRLINEYEMDDNPKIMADLGEKWRLLHPNRELLTNILLRENILQPFIESLKTNPSYQQYSQENLIGIINACPPILVQFDTIVPALQLVDNPLCCIKLIEEAKRLSKPIINLEKRGEFLQRFYGLDLSYSEQVKLCCFFWKRNQNGDFLEKLKSRTEAYLLGNLVLFELIQRISTYENEEDFKKNREVVDKFYYDLIDKRNQTLTTAIQPYLEENQSFISVHALNLPGLIKNLSNLGYNVKSVDTASKPQLTYNPTNINLKFDLGLHYLLKAVVFFELAATQGIPEAQEQLKMLEQCYPGLREELNRSIEVSYSAPLTTSASTSVTTCGIS